MSSDALLTLNPKRQVPTLYEDGTVKTDSLLIALEYLPLSLDAKLFRLADSNVEAAIIFLFRANLLEQKFGQSELSLFMRDAGISTFKASVDHLLDYLIHSDETLECNFGAVLLMSTILAAISLADELVDYRKKELSIYFSMIESDKTYEKIITQYQWETSNELPFEYSKIDNNKC
ncbi:hypothetical protein KO527_21940 [Pseudoalteromonas sp. C2R02]|uniref:hypothetical protein n=1 Tax=Pseudoalteromonas sp. C2R02 TaxID=2841565 RepID=UPI001C08D7BD|nr:hypothetical protein [Pseudoalteromonas sp. C2R02]MBU2972003.1 hypothetical protein [Pseudoalteromonas sp. C2R02]